MESNLEEPFPKMKRFKTLTRYSLLTRTSTKVVLSNELPQKLCFRSKPLLTCHVQAQYNNMKTTTKCIANVHTEEKTEKAENCYTLLTCKKRSQEVLNQIQITECCCTSHGKKSGGQPGSVIQTSKRRRTTRFRRAERGREE